MRIAFDARHARFAGIGRFTVELWTALRTIDPEAFALTTATRRSDFWGAHTPTIDAPTVPLRTAALDPREQFELALQLRELRPQVYHSPHFSLPLLTRTPTVVTVHDLFPIQHRQHARSRAARAYYHVLMPPSIKRADRVVAISQFTYDAIQQRFDIGPDKLRLVRHGLTPAHWEAPTAEATATVLRTYGITSPFLLHVGTPKWHKNLRTVLAALSPATLPLVCAGATTEQIEQHADVAGCRGTLLALGTVSDRDLRTLYGAATAVVIPSLYEGFGAATVEAMGAGTAIVASTGGALPETIGDAGLLVEPLDVEAWAQALLRIADDEELREELVARGRHRIASRDWVDCARDYYQVYAEVATE